MCRGGEIKLLLNLNLNGRTFEWLAELVLPDEWINRERLDCEKGFRVILAALNDSTEF